MLDRAEESFGGKKLESGPLVIGFAAMLVVLLCGGDVDGLPGNFTQIFMFAFRKNCNNFGHSFILPRHRQVQI